MHFGGRLKPCAEPVTSDELQVGAITFPQFDNEMFVPVLEPLVFVGRNIARDDEGTLYFQDAESYRKGIRFESSESDEADFYAQREGETNHIFEYEQALDALLRCSIHRKKKLGK